MNAIPNTSISQEELDELKVKDPLEALKPMMSSRGATSFDMPQSSSSMSEPFVSSKENLLRDLQTKILNIDLFQVIEENPNAAYEMKALLKKLNTLESKDSIIGFILEFEPLLERIVNDYRTKQENSNRLEMQTRARHQEMAKLEISQHQLAILGDQSKKET